VRTGLAPGYARGTRRYSRCAQGRGIYIYGVGYSGVPWSTAGYCIAHKVFQGLLKVLPHSVRVVSLGVSHRIGFSVGTYSALQAMWKRSMGAQIMSAPRGTQGVPGELGWCSFGGYSGVLKGGGYSVVLEGALADCETHTRIFSGKRGGYLLGLTGSQPYDARTRTYKTRFGSFNGSLFLAGSDSRYL
jgi:hypothetical protein